MKTCEPALCEVVRRRKFARSNAMRYEPQMRRNARDQRPWARALLALVVACGDRASSPSVERTPVEQARAWLASDTPLPAREEALTVAHAVSLLAAKEASPEEQARLYRLSADLRVRLYRVLHVDADAHEALNHLADAARVTRGKESACEAERARAKLVGDLHNDAVLLWKELTLARTRAEPLVRAGDSACAKALDADLAGLVAYRVSGEALEELLRSAKTEVTSDPATKSSASSAPPVAAHPENLVVSPMNVPASTEPVKVTKIDTYPAEGGGRVVVHLTGPTTFTAGSLGKDDASSKDPRIYVDIDRAKVKGIKREIEVGGAIKRVRVAPRDAGARIVLDLSGTMSRRVYYLPQPFRIVIDTSNKPWPTGAASPSAGVTVKRVAVDPGHGGHDAGAVGPTGLTEKEVALDVSRRAASLLSSELNIETLLTRDDDVFIPLEERTARANAFHADLFISIHCNANENGEGRGVEVFILDHDKDMNRANSRIAAVENGMKGKALDSAVDAEMAAIAGRLMSGEVSANSRRLGGLLQKSALASLRARYPDTTDHGLKSAGFYVLMGAEMPAALFETSFISNPEDESRLAKADYRQNLADAVVNAVKAYREGK